MSDQSSYLRNKLLCNLRRRSFLRGLGLAAAAVAGGQKAAWGRQPPKSLSLVEIPANPRGAVERLYAVVGFQPGKKAGAMQGNVARRLRQGASVSSKTLRIFHFNDMHNAMMVEAADDEASAHPLAHMVRRVNIARDAAVPDANQAVLLLTAGDDQTGGVFDALLGDRTGQGWITHPAYTAYSAAGVDVAAIGNHEFDHGARTLQKGIRKCSSFPMLSANLTKTRLIIPDEDFYPAVIAEAKGLRIGIIGVVTPVKKYFRKSGDRHLRLASPSQTLYELLPSVADVSDVVLILSHCGFGDTHAPPRAGQEWRFYLGEGDKILAKAISGLTEKPVVIIGGHTHTALNKNGLEAKNIFDGVPIVQAGGRGRYLGELVMHLTPEQPTRMTACLHKTKWTDVNAPTYGDYDHSFEQEVVNPLLEMVKRPSAAG